MRGNSLMFKRAVLLQLEPASPPALPLQTILDGLKISGYEADADTLGGVVEYLSQKGLVESKTSRISASGRRAALTSAGADYLESGDF